MSYPDKERIYKSINWISFCDLGLFSLNQDLNEYTSKIDWVNMIS